MADTYAIVESGGKQHRVTAGATIEVDRLAGDAGDTVALRPLMFRSDDEVILAGDELEKVKVEARIVEQFRGKKIHGLKYKAKKGYRRRWGHRSELTRLEVSEVKKLSRRPARKKEDTDGA